jgi:hypothetical protein
LEALQWLKANNPFYSDLVIDPSFVLTFETAVPKIEAGIKREEGAEEAADPAGDGGGYFGCRAHGFGG